MAATQYQVTNVTIDIANNTCLIEAQDMDFLYTIDSLDQEFEAPTATFRFSGPKEFRYLYKICQGQSKIRSRKTKTLADTFKALTGCYVLLPDQFRVPA